MSDENSTLRDEPLDPLIEAGKSGKWDQPPSPKPSTAMEAEVESSPSTTSSTTETKPTLLEATYRNVGDANVFTDVFGEEFETAKVNAFCQKVLASSGWSGSSGELLIIEEKCLAHLMVVTAFQRAATAPDAASFELYAKAGARLIAEVRHSEVTLRGFQNSKCRPGNKKSEKQA